MTVNTRTGWFNLKGKHLKWLEVFIWTIDPKQQNIENKDKDINIFTLVGILCRKCDLHCVSFVLKYRSTITTTFRYNPLGTFYGKAYHWLNIVITYQYHC